MKILSWTAATAFVSSSRKVERLPSTVNMVVSTLAVVDVPSFAAPSVVIQQPHDNVIMMAIHEWLLVPSANAATETTTVTPPPSQKNVALLREAFAAFYGVDRDLTKAQSLLTQAIDVWEQQPPDERAALYRVRGDCDMALLQPKDAQKDYTTAIDLLQGPGGNLADPSELPSALLGRARAIRSQVARVGKEASLQAAKDYQSSLQLSSREEWDTDQELVEDGASRNPYAAWEWGSSLRNAGLYEQAALAHSLASIAFDDIGDRARSVIASMDAGIDLASSSSTKSAAEAKQVLQKAIQRTMSVEGRDVELLQRLIAKEGEARIALASLLWENPREPAQAETQLSTACERLDQLEADASTRIQKLGLKPEAAPERLKFSIDDGVGALEISCSKFKQEKFLTETIQWPESLQKKLTRLQKLG